MRLKLHPEARVDLKEGKAFYRHRSPLAAVAFAHEIDRAISRISESPLRYPEGEHGTREFVMPWRFPYTIVYRVRKDSIVVIAFAHQSKEPGYWRDRA
ncbi:MAG: toxin ParE1/3/4 [Acidobacteriota bacterium]|jgi:plasmid stabilization system protein ParE|nr:toxin ParE1/3/4 [Acidobacteriota bacterium]